MMRAGILAVGLGAMTLTALVTADRFGDWPMRGWGALVVVLVIVVMVAIYDRMLWLADRVGRERESDKPRCGVTDGAGLEGRGEPYGCCNLPYDHYGVIHTETRNGKLWAQWRSVLAEDELTGSPERTAFVKAGGHRDAS